MSRPSDVGTAFMAATVEVMLALAWGKRHTGLGLENRPLLANASMTLIDGCLAAGILIALGAERVFGWWWTDPLAAAVVAVIALNEARHNWKASGQPMDATRLPGRD